ncbi:hypothetical protein S2091_4437 [Solimicrobium silvestre]|uniref:Uncharacterized protein n=1 Tax=Solimicrobium silvestre TaxID=2099400 RepID=A0A2S9GT35_9BURK|nr:hypothetical protein S2091_4437 [Solimicrobium silvestre]
MSIKVTYSLYTSIEIIFDDTLKAYVLSIDICNEYVEKCKFHRHIIVSVLNTSGHLHSKLLAQL